MSNWQLNNRMDNWKWIRRQTVFTLAIVHLFFCIVGSWSIVSCQLSIEMLQRIQTVYLLIIVALIVAMLFLPLAVLQAGDQFLSFDATGISTMTAQPELIYPTWGLFALTAIVALLSLFTIFLFKKRMLQIRLCIFNAILMLGIYGMFAFFIWNLKGQMADVTLNLKIALAFPIVGVILDYLAIRNIGADETLVRSLDRLRP